MELKVDRKSGVPIYIQVKNQIMNEIKNGNLKIGEQMPTERELSLRLNTSRNTVSAAYNILEQEGVLVSYQGRGTFVAEEAKTWKKYDVKDRLLRIIDLALEEALEMGMDTKEFLSIVQDRIKEKEEFIKEMTAAYVECNIEQASSFARELERATGIKVKPLVIQDIKDSSGETQEIIDGSDLIISTFNHVNEVKGLTEGSGKDVFGVSINPSLETIVKIARYPAGTKFGLICISREFQFKVQNALESAGLLNLEIIPTISKSPEDLIKVVEQSEVIIVSPGRREEVTYYARGKKEIIGFDYNLDQDSVKAVVSKVVEMKKHI